MKQECLNYNYVYNADYPVERLVGKIAESKNPFNFRISN